MNQEPENLILETFLEEVVGGVYPPDLTAKITQTLEHRKGNASAPTDGLVAQVVTPPPIHWSADAVTAPPTAVGDLQPATSRQLNAKHRQRERLRFFLGVAGSAALLLIALTVGAIGILQPRGPSLTQGSLDDSTIEGVSRQRPQGEVRIRDQQFAAASPTRRTDGTPSQTGAIAQLPPTISVAHQTSMPPKRVLKPASDEPTVVSFVNDRLHERWTEHSVTPSPPASDSDWCRRIYKRLLGRSPSPAELTDFRDSTSPHKRSDLADTLLDTEEYARHWSVIWCDALLGQADLSPSRSLANREELADYIFTALREDKPYSEWAGQLLTASGSNDANAPDHNAAVNFLLAGAARDAVTATDRTCRVFLGKQVVCAQCHDHPAAQVKQEEFWQINAFFRQMRVASNNSSSIARLTDADFFGESGAAKDAEVFYRESNGRLRIAYPKFKGYSPSHSGLLSDVNRRQELAEMIVNSEEFTLAAVNRVWSELLGYGFTQPVDDMGPHNPPSHPDLLARLSDELAAHAFDLDKLQRWIVLSDAFGLSSKPTPESWMDTPETGGRPLFARFYEPHRETTDLTRMFLAAANSGPARQVTAHSSLARRSWLGPPANEQLEIIDSAATDRVTGNGWLDILAESRMDRGKKVEHVFLSVLDRSPTRRESQAAKLVLADRMNDAIALREIWQMLLSSK